jgi:hypothetical protein
VLFGMSKSSTLWTSRSFVFPFISSLSPRDAQIGAMIDEVLTMLKDQQDKGVFCVCISSRGPNARSDCRRRSFLHASRRYEDGNHMDINPVQLRNGDGHHVIQGFVSLTNEFEITVLRWFSVCRNGVPSGGTRWSVRDATRTRPASLSAWTVVVWSLLLTRKNGTPSTLEFRTSVAMPPSFTLA